MSTLSRSFRTTVSRTNRFISKSTSIRSFRTLNNLSSKINNKFSKCSINFVNPLLNKQINTHQINGFSTQQENSPRTYEHILYETNDNNVCTITLNRPKQLNALCNALLEELVDLLEHLETNTQTRCIIITGSGSKAFCAGADIKEMESKTYMEAYNTNMFTIADRILQNVRIPIIAAVNGYALGGGCELAMICDIIIASNKAKFGQPEINLGTIPGIGGTQRLTRAIGKSRAMELCLTGDMITAQQASDYGLVSRIVEPDNLMSECMTVAEKIASKSLPIVKLAKDCVNKVYELSLTEGVTFERRLFHSTFSTNDQKEGMSAFNEKRKPEWQDC